MGWCIAFATVIAKFPQNRELLFVEFEGPAGLSHRHVGATQTPQRGSFTSASAKLAGKTQPLVVALDGLLSITHGAMDSTHASNRYGFPEPVANLGGDACRLFEEFGSFAGFAKHFVSSA